MTSLLLALALLSSPVIITNDKGGLVADRLQQISGLQGKQVEIRGECDSSCTMLLSVACVSKNARLGFHGPSSQYYGVALPPEEFDRVSHVMAEHYPPAIRNWFIAEARFTTMGLLTITGTEAVRLGAKKCDK